MSERLNPQPEPPGRAATIDVGHLAETVTRAIQNALSEPRANAAIRFPRIIVGIIAEPSFLEQAQNIGAQE